MTIFRRFETLFLLLAAVLVLAAGPPDYRTPGKDWAKGPVKWIMTEDEEKEWKKLHTDEERASFVKAPTKADKDTRGRNIWTYDPNEVTGIKAHLDLMFAGGGAAPLLLDRKKLEEYVATHPETRGIGWKIPAAQTAEALPDVPTATTRKPEEDLTPESKRQIPILQDLLAKGGGRTDVPFQIGIDSYAAADGTTLSVITIETPREAAHGSGDAALHPFARIEPAGEGKPVNLTGDLPFVPSSPGEAPPASLASFVYQARHNLAPGSYRLAVVVEDKVVPGQMGTLVKTIDVPDFREKDLRMSSVALLAGFKHLDPGQDPDEKTHAGPYVLGSFRLVPRASAVLTKSEAVTFYYQVYNPATDPAAHRPSLESTVTFFLKDGAGWKRYRPPVVRPLAGQVDLYSIDLKDLLAPNQPLPVDFKMEMKLLDKIGGKELDRDVFFTVR